jgi:hypothetical protein
VGRNHADGTRLWSGIQGPKPSLCRVGVATLRTCRWRGVRERSPGEETTSLRGDVSASRCISVREAKVKRVRRRVSRPLPWPVKENLGGRLAHASQGQGGSGDAKDSLLSRERPWRPANSWEVRFAYYRGGAGAWLETLEGSSRGRSIPAT